MVTIKNQRKTLLRIRVIFLSKGDFALAGVRRFVAIAAKVRRLRNTRLGDGQKKQ